MPSYKWHLVGGLGSFFLLAKINTVAPHPFTLNTWDSYVLALCFMMIGALFPDIDITSKIQRAFFICMVPILPYTMFVQRKIFFILTIVCFIVLIIKHRTLTHNIFFLFVCCFMMNGVIWIKNGYYQPIITLYIIYFFIGTVSHVCLDAGVTYIKRIYLKYL